MHGREGGERNVDSDLLQEGLDATGAIIIGKRMFGGWDGPWGDEPTLGVWGENPPFDVPVFVLTHPSASRSPSARRRLRSSATGSSQRSSRRVPRDVSIGSANVIQYLAAGLLEELQVSVVPVLLGGDVRLLDDLGEAPPKPEHTEV